MLVTGRAKPLLPAGHNSLVAKDMSFWDMNADKNWTVKYLPAQCTDIYHIANRQVRTFHILFLHNKSRISSKPLGLSQDYVFKGFGTRS
jgi:hypothetical protein